MNNRIDSRIVRYSIPYVTADSTGRVTFATVPARGVFLRLCTLGGPFFTLQGAATLQTFHRIVRLEADLKHLGLIVEFSLN